MGGQQPRRFTPVGHAQAFEDDADPMVDGVGRDTQFAGDLLGAQALQHEAQNLAVARRQAGDDLFAGLEACVHRWN